MLVFSDSDVVIDLRGVDMSALTEEQKIVRINKMPRGKLGIIAARSIAVHRDSVFRDIEAARKTALADPPKSIEPAGEDT